MADYTQPENDAVDFTLESYTQPANDNVDFTLEEGSEPVDKEKADVGPTTDPLGIPLGLDLPLRPLNLSNMNTGAALFIIGALSITGGAAALLRNYAAGIVWTLAVIALLLSGLLGIGLETFWVAVMATVLMLMFGVMMRWLA